MDANATALFIDEILVGEWMILIFLWVLPGMVIGVISKGFFSNVRSFMSTGGVGVLGAVVCSAAGKFVLPGSLVNEGWWFFGPAVAGAVFALIVFGFVVRRKTGTP